MAIKQTAKTAKGVKVAGLKRFDLKLVSEIRSELKKVVWPTRDEAMHLTMIVITVSLAVGIFLGGIDYIFFQLINWLMGIG